jgi:hypothetical protein
MVYRALALTLALVALPWLAAPASASGRQHATIFITHGIPGDNGFPVDISVQGPGGIRACLPGVTFKTVAGPFYVPAGTYRVAIGPASPTACGAAPVLGPVDIPYAAGEDAAIVAHLTASGSPTAGKYAVDLSPAGVGKGRVNVFHLAAAPEVDITVARGGATKLQLTEVANGDFADAGLRAGAYAVSFTPAGLEAPVFGPFHLRVRPFMATLAFAVGSLADDSFTVVTAFAPVQYR